MLAKIDNSSTMNDSAASGEASVSSSGNQMAPSKPEKKKRNLPGMPDPDADIIALSPKSLMAVNRFICEICNKGFKRDQNLQLHRRGHNLPWKLRQRLNKEVRKRVYVCPEESCIHHDPLRALGDLTGIKKHFFRKHGEKKWKCDKCLKKYAVQSDWKAHLKICGTREYKCDCGTLFTRRDSFITHRAFCDALAVESAKEQPFATSSTKEDMETCIVSSSPPSPPSLPTSAAQISALPAQCPAIDAELHEASTSNPAEASSRLVGPSSGSCCSSSSSVFASLFASSTTKFTDLVRAVAQPSATAVSLCLATNYESSTFDITRQEYKQYAPLPPPATSATALLQKAAQMGASATNTSALQGFGIVSSTSPSGQQKWNKRNDDSDSASMAAGLGLGLHYDGVSSLKELMMGSSSVFSDEHTTLDFLGLGMAAGGGPARGLSALMTSSCDLTVATTSSSGTDYSGEKMGRSS